MRILICDYANVMESDYSLTINSIKKILPDSDIVIEAYQDQQTLIHKAQEADALITAFLPLDEEFFLHMNRLKCVSINAVGYGNVDLAAATKSKTAVCHIREYCTQEVAEHTVALMEALNRNLKYYDRRIEEQHQWMYHSIAGGRPLAGQTLAIFGYGKIGKRVAKLAQAFDMKVMVVDPFCSKDEASQYGVLLVSPQEALDQANVITNHMNLTNDNYHYFNKSVFQSLKQCPIFINVGRGACVDEMALVEALDHSWIRAAGLDVLEAEKPDLEGHPLLGRDNVLITPHSAFYSDESMAKLQTISAENLVYELLGQKEKVHESLN